MARRKLRHLLTSRQLRRFLGVGAVAFTVEYSLFAILYGLGWTVTASQAFSFLAALVVSFCLNRGWTFQSKHSQPFGQWVQFGQYASLALFNLVLTTITIGLLVGHHVPALIAKIIVMAAVCSWNFLIYRYIIFRTGIDKRLITRQF